MALSSWSASSEAFAASAAWFVATTAAVAGREDLPALGGWTVRDLVGHTSRALTTVEQYLGAPAGSIELATPADYFVLVSTASRGDPSAVTQRGRDAGAALGEDLAGAVTAIADRVLARVRAAAADAPVATPLGGMRLDGYLPTRTFELVVHTCNLAAALGRPLDAPEAAAAQALALAGELAARSGDAGALLLAATGRGGWPHGSTVLQAGPAGRRPAPAV